MTLPPKVVDHRVLESVYDLPPGTISLIGGEAAALIATDDKVRAALWNAVDRADIEKDET